MTGTPADTHITHGDVLRRSDPCVTYPYLTMTGTLRAVHTGERIDVIPGCDISSANLSAHQTLETIFRRARGDDGAYTCPHVPL